MPSTHQPIGPLLGLTVSNVALQVTSAVLMKVATIPKTIGMATVLLVSVVLLLNFGRFLLWQVIHKRYDLSIAYPASALFFPCVVLASYIFGEQVGVLRIFAAGLVTLGVAVLMFQVKSARDGSS